LKKLLALFAVAMFSGCGVEAPSGAQGDGEVGRIEAAVAYCTACPSGSYTTGYSCSDSCNPPGTTCQSTGFTTNQVECVTASSVSGSTFSYCATNGHCRPPLVYTDTHYISDYSKTTGCDTDPSTPAVYNNTMTCVPVPSSGTIESCGFCPSGWTKVSAALNAARCTKDGGVVVELFVCTKS
jgi:hypothetical protein